jgi:hypothetical protein
MTEMLTPDRAREAYQSAIPNRREEYRLAAYQVPRDASYLIETMRLAKEELRRRLEMAADRVKQMIDSGWTPQKGETVAHVYLDMFSQYNNMNRNSFDDLYNVVNSAFDNVGIGDKAKVQTLYSREFAQYQVDVSTEFTHDVEFYMATKQPYNSNVTNLTVQGDVSLLQTGGVSTITQNIGLQSAEVLDALQGLKDAVNATNQPYMDALNGLLDGAITEARKPDTKWDRVKKPLDGFQNLVRTGGAIPSAYNLLAGLAAAHGVHFPSLPTAP